MAHVLLVSLTPLAYLTLHSAGTCIIPHNGTRGVVTHSSQFCVFPASTTKSTLDVQLSTLIPKPCTFLIESGSFVHSISMLELRSDESFFCSSFLSCGCALFLHGVVQVYSVPVYYVHVAESLYRSFCFLPSFRSKAYQGKHPHTPW